MRQVSADHMRPKRSDCTSIDGANFVNMLFHVMLVCLAAELAAATSNAPNQC
jgi:hypothetical protein